MYPFGRWDEIGPSVERINRQLSLRYITVTGEKKMTKKFLKKISAM